MVIHELNLILVHIPRTGGTSIESLFGQPLCDTSSPNKIIEAIGINTWKSYYKCAFVRNPFDKLASTFSYRELRKRYSINDIIQNKTEPVIEPTTPFSQYVESIYQLHKKSAPIPDLQTEWLYAGGKNANNDDLMANYPTGKPVVDFIGRFDRFEQDLHHILVLFNKLGDVPHLNSSQKTDYRSFYTAEDRDKISEVYKADIEKFNYGFDPSV